MVCGSTDASFFVDFALGEVCLIWRPRFLISLLLPFPAFRCSSSPNRYFTVADLDSGCGGPSRTFSRRLSVGARPFWRRCRSISSKRLCCVLVVSTALGSSAKCSSATYNCVSSARTSLDLHNSAAFLCLPLFFVVPMVADGWIFLRDQFLNLTLGRGKLPLFVVAAPCFRTKRKHIRNIEVKGVGLNSVGDCTAIELISRDRPGLLSEITAILASLHVNVATSTQADRRLHQLLFADRDYEETCSETEQDRSMKPNVTIDRCEEKDYLVVTVR